MRFRPTIVVLAAGAGRRFVAPQHKLQQPLLASTVIGTTLRKAIETQLQVVVVTTAALAPVVTTQIATRDVVVLSAEEAARGMGHSIAVGVSERSGASGWLILPGDMPLVQSNTMLLVATALQDHAVVCPEFRGRRGHPVGFAAELYSELITLSGDEGARRLVARYPSFGIDVADAGVLQDIDTVADLEAVQLAGAAKLPAV
jgi:molybdenum cofactor cytidylyltransferase